MKVTAPDGTRWKVGRQCWPERDVDAVDPAAELGSGGGGGGDGGWFPDLGDADEFVVGFRNSGEPRDAVAAALSSGRVLPLSRLPR